MCGRYVVARTLSGELSSILDGVPGWPHDYENYNIAPMTSVPVVTGVKDEDSRSMKRRAELMHWGFVASWRKSVHDKPQPINARWEGVATNGMFRSAFARRHCLVPASGYYEWMESADGVKQPFYISAPGGLVFAGIFETWGEGDAFRSMAIITRDAVGPASVLHDRLPVMLPVTDVDRWLAADFETSEQALAHLRNGSERVAQTLQFHPVDRRVGNVRNTGPDLILPIPPGE